MKKYIWYILLILLTIPAFIKLVRPGFFPIQDDMQVFRMYEMGKCISDLQIPCRWIPDGGYGYGYPQFNFYSPLIYYVGYLIHLVGFQFIDTIKILIASGFMLMGVGMFLLVREFFGNFPGLVASILYIYAPYHAQQVYVRGSLSEFWAGVFFPFILWAIYKNKFVWTAVFVAGLILTHNLLSVLFFPVIIFWCLYWKKFSPALIFGIGLSAFFLLPLLLETKFVHVETLLGGYFDYRQHFVTIRELFISNQWGYGSSTLGPIDDLSLSTGIVHWIMGAVAVIIAVKRRLWWIIGLGAVEFVILFLMHQRSSFIWQIITPLSYLQFPWRLLSISSFVLSVLAGYAVYNFSKTKHFLGGLTIALVLILHLNFFTPKNWFYTNDREQLSGGLWEKQLTASIFDYLPIYAELPPESKAPNRPEVLKGNALFITYNKGSYYQSGKVKVLESATLRAPIYDFPGMKVYMDGEVVSHVNNDCSLQKRLLAVRKWQKSQSLLRSHYLSPSDIYGLISKYWKSSQINET